MKGEEGYGAAFRTAVSQAGETRTSCAEAVSQLKERLADCTEDFEWFLTLFEDPSELEKTPITELIQRLIDGRDNLALLEEWIDFRKILEQGREKGLGDYLDQAQDMEPEAIIPAFQKRFFHLWLDAVAAENPALADFRGKNHEALIEDFRKLDQEQFANASQRIRHRLIAALPDLACRNADLALLRKELNKQRKHLPLAQLFRAIPDLILNLKPCIMMSPLSVSLFLDAKAMRFDTVIFDEASQVCTENAIGALIRGKQAIIAGDRHQLPPTNFFAAANHGIGLR